MIKSLGGVDMGRLFRTMFSFLFIFALLFTLAGCGSQSYVASQPTSSQQTAAPITEPITDPNKEAYKEDPASFVVFYRSTEPRNTFIPIAEVMAYQSQYADCNSTWFRDQLEGEELCIYNAYLYAMENCFIGFELYVEDNSKDFSYIREALSLDSPFMSQNYDMSESTHRYPINYIGERISSRVEQFTESRWEKNLEALEACRQIVEEMPDTCITQQEKMEYLYRYVCEYVQYDNDKTDGHNDFLYDAVIEGKTNCDGYSNMLTLLFNLAGIKSCEAMGGTPGEKSGHTWVVAELDGKLYNFDATFEDTDGQDDETLYYFGFSDELVTIDEFGLEDRRPKCTDISRDFSYADMIVSDINDTKTVKQIVELVEQRAKDGQDTTLVAIQAAVSEEEYDRFFDRCDQYATIIRHIEIYYEDMRNSTLWEIVATTR